MKIADAYPLNAGMTITYPDKKVTFKYPDGEKLGDKMYWSDDLIFSPLKYIYINAIFYSVIGVTVISILARGGFSEKIFLFYVALILIGYGLTYLLSLYIGFNYEKFKYWFPKFNFAIRIRTEGYNKCEVKDLKSKTFEIPLFANVILDYTLIGDYAEKLEKVEIIPHDFKYCQLDKHDEIDDSLWRAVFTFKDVPKSGYMWVYFT